MMYGPQAAEMYNVMYLNGPGQPFNGQTCPMLLPVSSHPYQSTHKIWKQSEYNSWSNRENDEADMHAA